MIALNNALYSDGDSNVIDTCVADYIKVRVKFQKEWPTAEELASYEKDEFHYYVKARSNDSVRVSA